MRKIQDMEERSVVSYGEALEATHGKEDKTTEERDARALFTC